MKVTRGSGFLEEFLAKQRAKKANKFIDTDYRKGRILDIGCGSYPYFLETTVFKEKYGIDPSIDFSLVKNTDIILKKNKIDRKAFPFADNFFDIITMLAVFEHIETEELKYILKDVNRVLKKGGIFIITTPAPWSDKLLHSMAKTGFISEEEIHEHKHNHPKSRVEDMLMEAGFERNKVESGYFEFHMNMWFTAKK